MFQQQQILKQKMCDAETAKIEERLRLAEQRLHARKEKMRNQAEEKAVEKQQKQWQMQSQVNAMHERNYRTKMEGLAKLQ